MSALTNPSFEDAGMGNGQAAGWTLAAIGSPAFTPAVFGDGRHGAEHFAAGWSSNENDLSRFQDADLQGFELTSLRTIPQMIEFFRELWDANQLDLREYTYSAPALFLGPLLERVLSTSTPITIPDNTDLAGGFTDTITMTAASNGATTTRALLRVAHPRAADLRIGLDADSTPGVLGNLWDLQDDPTGTGINITLDVTSTLGIDPIEGVWTIYGHDTVATNYGSLQSWGVETFDAGVPVEAFETNWGNAPPVLVWDDVFAVSAGVVMFEDWRETKLEFDDADLTAAVFNHASGSATVEHFDDVSVPLAASVNDPALKRFYAFNSGFAIDDRVQFNAIAGGILPSGITGGVDYWVTLGIGDNIFTVSQVLGGADADPVDYGFAPFYVAKTPALYWTQILT